MKATGDIAASYSGNGKKWLHVDGSKRPPTSTLSLQQNDPGSSAKMLATVATEVTETGEGKYSGVLDLTKTPSMAGQGTAAQREKFQSVPFTAEVSDGYLTKVTIDMAKVVKGGGKSVTAYSDFGTPVDITAPPASQTKEMTAQDIKKMGG